MIQPSKQYELAFLAILVGELMLLFGVTVLAVEHALLDNRMQVHVERIAQQCVHMENAGCDIARILEAQERLEKDQKELISSINARKMSELTVRKPKSLSGDAHEVTFSSLLGGP